MEKTNGHEDLTAIMAIINIRLEEKKQMIDAEKEMLPSIIKTIKTMLKGTDFQLAERIALRGKSGRVYR